VDKERREAEEKRAAQDEEYSRLFRQLLAKYDADHSDCINLEEFRQLITDFF
jgi:siroheme synthase (precorrin-2 oxidase/ferrochelatase)